MKWRKVLAVAVLLATPLYALAQVVANDGSSTRQQTSVGAVGGFNMADTTMKALRLNSSGQLQVDDADRDRDNFVVHSGAINDTLGAAGLTSTNNNTFLATQWSAESTTVLTAYPYRRFALGLRVIPVGGDTSAVRLAVQVRGHSSSLADTASTWAWYPFSVAGPVAGTAIDSLGHFTSGAFTAASGYSPVWSGEFLVNYSAKRGYGHLASGTMFGYPAGILIGLNGPRGENFWAPYMSVRVRMLQGPVGTRVKLDVMMGS